MVISTDRRLERDGRGAFSQQLAHFCKSRCEKPEGTQKPIPAAECSFTRLQSHRGFYQLAGPIRQRPPMGLLIKSGERLRWEFRQQLQVGAQTAFPDMRRCHHAASEVEEQ